MFRQARMKIKLSPLSVNLLNHIHVELQIKTPSTVFTVSVTYFLRDTTRSLGNKIL